MNTNFNDRLIEVRKTLGLNQDEFGLLGGVKRNAQIKYESGDRSPNVDYIEALIRNGVDMMYVIFGKSSSFSNSSGITEDRTKYITKTKAYAESELVEQKGNSVPIVEVRNGTPEHEWLEYFRILSDEDRALVEPTIKGLVERAVQAKRDTA